MFKNHKIYRSLAACLQKTLCSKLSPFSIFQKELSSFMLQGSFSWELVLQISLLLSVTIQLKVKNTFFCWALVITKSPTMLFILLHWGTASCFYILKRFTACCLCFHGISGTTFSRVVVINENFCICEYPGSIFMWGLTNIELILSTSASPLNVFIPFLHYWRSFAYV